ncbi:MAG: cyclic nucleotide-binding domain-containing protein [bacterium]
MDRTDKKIRKLRDKAEKLRQGGNVKKAIEIYHELCSRDPEEPRWPHLAGEAHKRLGQIDDAVKYFTKAAALYGKNGWHVKCVALCKVLLAMDPLNATGLRLLEEVSGTDKPKFPMAAEPREPTPSQAALAATGGRVLSTPAPGRAEAPSESLSLPRPKHETSPKELQAIDITELEALLEKPVRPGGAPPPPPPPPITRTAPLVDKPPRPDPTQSQLSRKPRETLDIAIELEEPLDDPKATHALTIEDIELLDNAVGHATESDDDIEVLDMDDLDFMESLEHSEATVSRTPMKKPTLELDAPLETLDLEDVMPGTLRKPTGDAMPKDSQELFEVPLDEPQPGQTGDFEEYKRRITPGQEASAPTPPGLFQKLGIDVMKSLVAQMSYVEKSPGQEIVKQGQIGGSLYVIVRGEVAIIKEVDGRRIHVTTLKDGEFFGEMALITDTPRVATVEAITTVEMLEVSRDTLRLLIRDFPQVVPVLIKFLKDRLLEIFVKTSDLLKPVPEAKRWVLARKFKLYEIKEGKVILREGKPSGGLMIFLAGTARATRQRRGKTVTLGLLEPGSLVGEISLLTGGPAVATVTATSKAWLLAISQAQWKALTNAFPDMREYVEALARKRREENAAIISGDAGYSSQSLRLV